MTGAGWNVLVWTAGIAIALLLSAAFDPGVSAQTVSPTQRLVQGCNNVVAPSTQTPQQVADRVEPRSAAVAIWKQAPGSRDFLGAAIGNVPPEANNLSSVTALDAIWVCVSAPATYRLT